MKWFVRKGILFWPTSWPGYMAYLLGAFFGFEFIKIDYSRSFSPDFLEKVMFDVFCPSLLGVAAINTILYSTWLLSSEVKETPSAVLRREHKAEPKSYSWYKLVFIFTIGCLVPGLLPVFTEQWGPGLSGTLYSLGQLLSIFTSFALPCLSIYHFGFLIATIRPKQTYQRNILIMSAIGILISVGGFMITMESCRDRAGFP